MCTIHILVIDREVTITFNELVAATLKRPKLATDAEMIFTDVSRLEGGDIEDYIAHEEVSRISCAAQAFLKDVSARHTFQSRTRRRAHVQQRSIEKYNCITLAAKTSKY